MTSSAHITDSNLLSVLTAASTARQQCLEMLDLLALHTSTEDETSISARKIEARIAMLRGLNRRAIMEVRQTKAETTEARQEIDALHLGLQNLYYEQRHLRGEIGACEGFE